MRVVSSAYRRRLNALETELRLYQRLEQRCVMESTKVFITVLNIMTDGGYPW